MQTIEITMLVTDPALCTACRACEIACHFHHTSTFGTAQSSVRVDYEPEASAVQIYFLPTCDLCATAPAGACVTACVPGAVRTRA
jgi:Fe-S-cluster-containing dehydrogenase component